MLLLTLVVHVALLLLSRLHLLLLASVCFSDALWVGARRGSVWGGLLLLLGCLGLSCCLSLGLLSCLGLLGS